MVTLSGKDGFFLKMNQSNTSKLRKSGLSVMLALFLVDARYRYDAGINTFDTANVD